MLEAMSALTCQPIGSSSTQQGERHIAQSWIYAHTRLVHLRCVSRNRLAVKRNAYIEHQIFVTAYDPSQKYAGGEYAFQSKGDDTLMTWTDLDRPIVNTDIVAYYTIGFHHIPRMEDWPIMPTNWGSFQLRPFNFFTHNPAITHDPTVTMGLPLPSFPQPKAKGISIFILTTKTRVPRKRVDLRS
jgi:hypothetical protein